MNRRNAIKQSAVSFGALGSLPYLSTFLQGCGSGEVVYKPINLTQEQYDVVWHFAERILPRTETPGASDAGVAAYVDQLFSGYFDEESAAELMEKLEGSMEKTMTQYGKSFDRLSIEDQLKILKEEEKDPESFYQAMRGITLWAYYTSEIGIKSMDYRPVPGQYQGCIEVTADTKNLIGNRW